MSPWQEAEGPTAAQHHLGSGLPEVLIWRDTVQRGTGTGLVIKAMRAASESPIAEVREIVVPATPDRVEAW